MEKLSFKANANTLLKICNPRGFLAFPSLVTLNLILTMTVLIIIPFALPFLDTTTRLPLKRDHGTTFVSLFSHGMCG